MKIQSTHFESMFDQTELAGEWNFPDPVIFGGRRPLVIFAHNRAGRDRHSNGPAIPQYDGFKLLAQGLAAAGYAVFRYDKRGCASSKGKYIADDEKTLGFDYVSAVLHAVSHSDVDDWRVFLLGQSQGTRLIINELYDIQKTVSVQGLILLSNINDPSLFSNVDVPYLIVCGQEDHAFREISEEKLVHDPVRIGLERGLDTCLGIVIPKLGHLLAEEEATMTSEEIPLEFFKTKMDASVLDSIIPWLHSRSQAEPDSEDGDLPWWKTYFDEEYMLLHRHWEEPRTRAEVDRILHELSLPAGAHIVDIGCGYGRHSIELALRGFAVTAIDLSDSLLAQTIHLAGQKNIPIIGLDSKPTSGQIQIIHGDMRTVKAPWVADAAVMVHSIIGYFDDSGDDQKVLNQISKMIKTGGKLFIETTNREWLIREMQGQGYSRDFDETPYGTLLREIRWDWFCGVTIERRKLTRSDLTIRRSELRMRHYPLSIWRDYLSKNLLDIKKVLPGVLEMEPFSGVQSQRLSLVVKKTLHVSAILNELESEYHPEK